MKWMLTTVVVAGLAIGCIEPGGDQVDEPEVGQAQAPSNDLLEFAIDVAEGSEPSNRTHTNELLQAYQARGKRSLSEPQYITDLSFVWLLLESDLTAKNYIKISFCEAYLTRLSNLLTEGEIFSAPPASVETPADAFAAIRSGAWSPVYRGSTNNNRHAREAAALAIASLVVNDAKTRIGGCFGVSLSELFAPGSPLEQARVAAIDQIFAPTGNYNLNKYSLVTSDGAYKEGAGYLEFTNQVLMPMVFFYHHYKGVNLFENPGEFTAVMPERLRALFGWLNATQNDDGQWPSIEDAATIEHGRSFSTAVGVYMMRHLSATMPTLRKTYCGMLGRANQFLYPAELEAACAAGTAPFESCGYQQYVRLEGLLFGPSASGGAGSLQDDLGIAVPPACGAYYRRGTAQYRDGPARGLYPIGGQLYLRSSDSRKVQVRMFNAGSWWEPGGADFNGYTSGGVTYTTHAACDAAFAAGTATHRTCHFWLDLRAWFSTGDQPLDWHPRTANHKRYDDTHLELRAFGKDLLIGPGKMGYIGDGTSYPYEEWSSPAQYNLTRTRQRWPKTLYLQGDVGAKMELVSSRAGCGELYRMGTDTYDRYVLWAHERYLIVTDRARAGGPLYMKAQFHVRGDRSSWTTPRGRSRIVYDYVDRATDGTELERDDDTHLQIYSLHGNSVLDFTETTARDSCHDSDYVAHAGAGYCTHSVLGVATRSASPQRMLPFLLWPQQGNDSVSLTFSNAVMTGDTLERIDVRVTGAGVDDTWTIDAADPASMLDGICGG